MPSTPIALASTALATRNTSSASAWRPGPVERLGQQCAEPLAQRVLGHQRPQLGDQLGIAPGRQVGRRPGLDGGQPGLLQASTCPVPRRGAELNADCLAGVFWDNGMRDGTVIEEGGDTDAIYPFLFAGGSGTNY